MLDRITPLLITFDEAPNIGRALESLEWADRIVVVDSFSTDGTIEILAGTPNVDVYQREFDSLAAQCNFGLSKIATEWVLSLDADYLCTPELIEEIGRLPEEPDVAGYEARFRYVVLGRRLRGSLYPPRVVLHRRSSSSYSQEGHAHRVKLDGEIRRLDGMIVHDDRKPLYRWMESQRRYAEEEARKLLGDSSEDSGLSTRLRKWGVTPFLVPWYCLGGKGLILDGYPGVYYTAQRTYAEALIVLKTLDARLRRSMSR